MGGEDIVEISLHYKAQICPPSPIHILSSAGPDLNQNLIWPDVFPKIYEPTYLSDPALL